MIKKRSLAIFIISMVTILLVVVSWRYLRNTTTSSPDPQPSITAQEIDLTPAIDMDTEGVTSDNVIELHYRWETGPQWTSPPDTVIFFVHLLDEDGVKICQDDHTPPVPMTQWEADQTYEYSRIIYIPITLLKKNVVLLVGLYDRTDATKHFALKGLPKYSVYHRYLAKSFVLFPSRQEYSEFLTKYNTGWYQPELDKNGNVVHRWMERHGVCELVNPKADAYLFLDLWVPNKHLAKPATLTILLNGTPLQIPELENDALRTMFEIPAKQLGNSDLISLVIETDQTFVPRSHGIGDDTRELGIAVKKILLRGRRTNTVQY